MSFYFQRSVYSKQMSKSSKMLLMRHGRQVISPATDSSRGPQPTKFIWVGRGRNLCNMVAHSCEHLADLLIDSLETLAVLVAVVENY